MPTIEENQTIWDGEYNWNEAGNEWSAHWGGTVMQWFGTLLPRIHRFVPAPVILEIAPGFGRWSQFLARLCDELILVDLSAECAEACQQRFARLPHVASHQNDGRTLPMVEDARIDFAFSFDSLVHADEHALGSYVAELARVLRPGGRGFVHHSNAGEYSRDDLVGLCEDLHFRDFTMSAEKMRGFIADHGLVCVSQEIIPWGTERALLDTLTVVAKPGPDHDVSNSVPRILRNHLFMREAEQWLELSHLYAEPHRRERGVE